MSNHSKTPDTSQSSLLANVTVLRTVAPRSWQVNRQLWLLGDFPKLMGIVNVTPDSFSDGGQFHDVKRAVDHALQLVEDGADILDVGGESTRPGATPVPVDEELRRVVPVIRELVRQTKTPISVDTYKAEVAEQALEAGASIVNDISGLTFDVRMPDVCRNSDCGIVLMHIQGTPQTMQNSPQYGNVVADVRRHFQQRLAELADGGIAADRVVLDPGIGFGKTAEHNLELLSHIGEFQGLGRPVLIGHSRKRFLKKVLGREVDERAIGTVGVSLALAAQGIDLLRIHDVRATRDALLAWDAVIRRCSRQVPALT